MPQKDYEEMLNRIKELAQKAHYSYLPEIREEVRLIQTVNKLTNQEVYAILMEKINAKIIELDMRMLGIEDGIKELQQCSSVDIRKKE
jgi:hypothetical protein